MQAHNNRVKCVRFWSPDRFGAALFRVGLLAVVVRMKSLLVLLGLGISSAQAAECLSYEGEIYIARSSLPAHISRGAELREH